MGLQPLPAIAPPEPKPAATADVKETKDAKDGKESKEAKEGKEGKASKAKADKDDASSQHLAPAAAAAPTKAVDVFPVVRRLLLLLDKCNGAVFASQAQAEKLVRTLLSFLVHCSLCFVALHATCVAWGAMISCVSCASFTAVVHTL